MSPTHRSPNQDTSRRNRADSPRKSRAEKHARLRPRQLRCEPLEDRRLLSVFTNNTQTPIKDNGTITSQISVPNSFLVGDLNVKLNITHTRAPDLDVFLISPDGTRVELFTDVGTTKSKNFTNTVLDDGATKSITLGAAPFTGAFRPEGNLSIVEGKQAQGTWKLEITDDQKQSTGTLESWSIDITSAGVPANNFIDTNPTMLGNAGRTAGSQNFYPSRKVVVSDNGDAMAVWLESKGPGDTGPWSAMAARYVAGSWQTPVVIMDGNPADTNYGLELVGDGLGNYLAVIEQAIPNAYNHLSAKRYIAGSGWLAAEPIAGGNAGHPRASMAHDADGVTRAVVAWGAYWESTILDVRINRLDNFASGSWAGEELAENLPSDPGVSPSWIDVAMAQNGDFMLVFAEPYQTTVSPPSDAYYRVYRNGNGWEGPEALLEYRSEAARMPMVTMNSSGAAMVVWNHLAGTGPVTKELWARRWNGAGWDTDPQRIVDSGGGDQAVFDTFWRKAALNEKGEAIVFWGQQRDGSAFSNAYVRHHDGTQWGEITKLDTEDLGSVGVGGTWAYNGSEMNIAIDDVGNAAAVWTQSDGAYINIWESQFDGTTWSTAEKLENASLDAVLPSVDMSAGVAQVIWTQSDGSLNHMYTATLSQLALSSPVAAAATLSGNDAALASMYDVPLKKIRVDTVQRSESRTVESHTRDLSYTVGAAPNYVTGDNRWATDHDSQSDVDDLFAEWDADPLELVSLPDLGV